MTSTETDPFAKIGALVKETRTKLGKSQGQLAEEMTKLTGDNYFHTTIGKIERGTRSISVIEAVALAEALIIPLEDIMNLAKPDSPSSKVQKATRALGTLGFEIMVFDVSISRHQEVFESALKVDLPKDSASYSDLQVLKAYEPKFRAVINDYLETARNWADEDRLLAEQFRQSLRDGF